MSSLLIHYIILHLGLWILEQLIILVALSNYAGIVHFAPNFIIYNVLYVPYFSFNIFSISKFLSSLNYKLTFSGLLCQI
uniref:Uncharacterized protein n=1 Tax=Cajanus cajan TaxID=3821 RepID=A0A151TJV2_CAJCA|nr:hypothetical protein KK1_013660 [Cajanus cajan]